MVAQERGEEVLLGPLLVAEIVGDTACFGEEGERAGIESECVVVRRSLRAVSGR